MTKEVLATFFRDVPLFKEVKGNRITYNVLTL
jgi:hypothetical protein